MICSIGPSFEFWNYCAIDWVFASFILVFVVVVAFLIYTLFRFK